MEAKKSCHTPALLFCYLTVVVEKLYSEIRLCPGSLAHNARQHKGRPSQSGQKEEPNLELHFTAHPQPEKGTAFLPSVGCVSPGLCIDLPLIESLLLTLGSFHRKKH